MAPKKASLPTATTASAADYFTRGKKSATIDRVIAAKKTVITAPSLTYSDNNNSNNNSNNNNNNSSSSKFTTEQKRQALKRKGKRVLKDTVTVISESNDNVDQKEVKEIDKVSSMTTTTTASHVCVDTNNDNKDPAFNEVDFEALNDYRFDDSFESQSPQHQLARQLQSQTNLPMAASILEPLTLVKPQPQIEVPKATNILDPLTRAPSPVNLSTRQSHSHARVVPVDIKKGSMSSLLKSLFVLELFSVL
jgi:hypothetical protein